MLQLEKVGSGNVLLSSEVSEMVAVQLLEFESQLVKVYPKLLHYVRATGIREVN